MTLVQQGILQNPEVIMEALNIGNVRELVEKEMAFRAEQAQNDMQMEATKTGIQGQPNQNFEGEDELRSAVADLKAEVGL